MSFQSPSLLFWSISFTAAYCSEITVEFVAAAVAPEYNSPCSARVCLAVVCCALLCSSRLSRFFFFFCCCSLLGSASTYLRRHILLCPLLACRLLLLFCPDLLLFISSAMFHFLFFHFSSVKLSLISCSTPTIVCAPDLQLYNQLSRVVD